MERHCRIFYGPVERHCRPVQRLHDGAHNKLDECLERGITICYRNLEQHCRGSNKLPNANRRRLHERLERARAVSNGGWAKLPHRHCCNRNSAL